MHKNAYSRIDSFSRSQTIFLWKIQIFCWIWFPGARVPRFQNVWLVPIHFFQNNSNIHTYVLKVNVVKKNTPRGNLGIFPKCPPPPPLVIFCAILEDILEKTPCQKNTQIIPQFVFNHSPCSVLQYINIKCISCKMSPIWQIYLCESIERLR